MERISRYKALVVMPVRRSTSTRVRKRSPCPSFSFIPKRITRFRLVVKRCLAVHSPAIS